jgi:hypothetical protein
MDSRRRRWCCTELWRCMELLIFTDVSVELVVFICSVQWCSLPSREGRRVQQSEDRIAWVILGLRGRK